MIMRKPHLNIEGPLHVVCRCDKCKAEKQEPVALVTGVYGGRFTHAPIKASVVLPVCTALYTHPQPKLKQDKPVAWEALTKVTQPKGTPRTIFTDKVRADEWLSDFVEGAAWLKPLVYQNTHPQPRKPLTDEQIDEIAEIVANMPLVGIVNDFRTRFARAIEKAHDIKE